MNRRSSSPLCRGSSKVRASRPVVGPKSLGSKVLQTISRTTSVCPFLLLELKKSQLRALVDSGSARSIISSKVCEDLERQGLIKRSEQSSVVCWTASQEILPISRVVSFKFKIEGFSWVWSFLVSPALGVECIIGADFICKSGLVIDIQEHQCYFKFNRGVVIPFLGYQGTRQDIQEIECPTHLETISISLSSPP